MKAAVALVAVTICTASGAATADALPLSPPRGSVFAADALSTPNVDAPSGRVVFMSGRRQVAIVDPVTGARRDVDVSAGCEDRDDMPIALRGAGGGYALLNCVEQPPPITDGGVTRPASPRSVPRVLDLSNGTVTTPLGLEQLWGRSRSWWGIGAEGISIMDEGKYVSSAHLVLDWRTGRLTPGELHDAVLPGTRMGWKLGMRNVDSVRPLTVTLPACNVQLQWEVSAIAEVAPVIDALMLAEADRGSAPRTLTRVPLAGVCERTTSLWSPVTVAVSGRSVSAGPVAGAGVDRESAAITSIAIPTRRPTLRVRPPTTVRITTAAPALSVRWRLGDGRLRATTGRGRTWSLTVPRSLGRPRELRLETRFEDGVTVRHNVRLTRLGARR
jgi:hypothetical protein